MIGTLRHSILGVNPAPPAICKPWQWQDQHTASTYAGSNSMRSCMKLDNSTYISGQKVAEEGKSSISAKTWIGEIVQFGLVYAIYIYIPHLKCQENWPSSSMGGPSICLIQIHRFLPGKDVVAGSLRCDVHPRKGRILLAEKTFACGTKLLNLGKMHELGWFSDVFFWCFEQRPVFSLWSWASDWLPLGGSWKPRNKVVCRKTLAFGGRSTQGWEGCVLENSSCCRVHPRNLTNWYPKWPYF